MKKSARFFIVSLLIMAGLFLLSQYGLIWAHGPDPAGTIVLKGTLGPVDAGKGMVTVLDKKGKKYAIKLVKGSQVLICDAYGCHMGRGSNALKGYKYEFPSGVPVVADFDPKTGEADRIDIHIDERHHYLDMSLGGMDTEE